MTVSTVVDHNDYTGNGVTTSFPYTFRIFTTDNLLVTVTDLNLTETVLTLDTDYSVTGAGGYSGGNVVLTSPLASGWKISIARDLAPTQETDLRNQGKFFAEVHEDAFDKLTMLIQQAFSRLNILNRRAIKVPEDGNWVAPKINDRKNKIFAWSDEGKPVAIMPPSGSASDVLIELAKTTGAGLSGYDNTITYPEDTVGAALNQVESWSIANDSASYRSRNISKLSDVHYKVRMRQAFTALFQGDSMTAGMDRTSTDVIPPQDGDYLTRATFNYPYTFQSFMRQSSGVTVNVVMRAISGLTAEQAVNRPEWQTNPNCNIAFLMYALNDTWTGVSIDTYMSSMETLIRRFIDWGMGVVVLTPASGGQGLTNGLAQIYGQRIKNLARVYGCAHFDAHEAQYNRIFGVVQSDDTHFNSAGYSQLGVQIASMVMAGGLLDEYTPICSERQTWPGKQDSSIGYCDAEGNISIGYTSNAYTLQSTAGQISAGTVGLMSYSFYLDAEAAEVEVIGSWVDSKLFYRVDNYSGGSGQPYYAYQGNVSSDLGLGLVGTLAGTMRAIDAGQYAAQRKNLGTLIGRGWKTISLFNARDGSATDNAYVQLITIRPIPLHLTNSSLNGVIRGSKDTMTARVPNAVGVSTTPSPVQLGNVLFPLPYDLYPKAQSLGNWFDCGMAKLTIKCNGGTHGNAYFEAIITKSAGGNNYLVTPLPNTVGTWPTFTATLVGRESNIIYARNSIGMNMPLRDVALSGNSKTFTGGVTDKRGMHLQISASWPSGTEKTGFYSITVESASGGSGATAISGI